MAERVCGFEDEAEEVALDKDLYSLYFAAAIRIQAEERVARRSGRTYGWLVLDLLDRGISAMRGSKVAFPCLDFCAKGSNVHGRRGGRVGREGETR